MSPMIAHVLPAGESMEQPLRYYHNITSNAINLLEAMRATGVSRVCPLYTWFDIATRLRFTA